jgi:hypothetical protein
MATKKYLTVEDAAEQYSMSERMLRSWALQGKVKASKVGHRWYIEVEEMERLFKDGENAPYAPRKRGRR